MTNVTETAVSIQRNSSEEALHASSMTDLTIDFYGAAMLLEDTLDRFDITRTMSKAYYYCCMQGNMEAFKCYSPMKTALADLQSGYGSIMAAAELSVMNTTKRDLITRLSANWSDLEQWVSNNPIATIPFSQQTPSLSSDSVQ